MLYTAEISSKTVHIEISDRAIQALQKRQSPLIIEMELYFSCLIRKALRFKDVASIDQAANRDNNANTVRVTDNLFLSFRPVMTEVCKVTPGVAAPPVTDFPIAKIAPYVPKWVNVDYQQSGWSGEFGYTN